ncbi:hypothetical protein LEP1GSC199_1645 [Leptospira vanthielii serovar Holland str. Waz Holland = ATCC 700522]|uniref:Uncharacterized protein n=1 Tax=Leptospira vanthielii serovar Holland str. Waz Holland = ATCC 700522 TaxID=1218591 RepID=N1WBU9_9LEPT|nr:hypothetical protein LEP1GSC199_1645 [Leptospira vanthielii serovar Holland str. Waz Holland = ATCC 700522]
MIFSLLSFIFFDLYLFSSFLAIISILIFLLNIFLILLIYHSNRDIGK